MGGVPNDDALTLQAAAEVLGVRPQRVNQLLVEGVLEGPVYEGRAPKGAGRVWRQSLAAELARRSEDQSGAEDAPRGVPGGEATPAITGEVGQLIADLRHREASVRAAALELKAIADTTRLALAEERSRLEQLEAENAALRARLSARERQAGLSDQALQAYSDALTQLLGPLAAPDLDI